MASTLKLFLYGTLVVALAALASWGAVRLAQADTARLEPAAATTTTGPVSSIRQHWDGAGTLAIPAQMPPGTWLLTVKDGAKGCYWALLKDLAEGPKSKLEDGAFERGGYKRLYLPPRGPARAIQFVGGCSWEQL